MRKAKRKNRRSRKHYDDQQRSDYTHSKISDLLHDRRRLNKFAYKHFANPESFLRYHVRSQPLLNSNRNTKRRALVVSRPGARHFQNQTANLYRITVCHSRKLRRAVLFMTGKTGKGSKNPVRKFTEKSRVRC